MNRLSKEQADWLIDLIKNKFHELAHKNREPYPQEIVYLTEATKIINQCTEKEFPMFNVDAGCEPPNVKHLTIEKSFCDNCLIRLHNNEGEPTYHFTKEQFLRFAEGVNKIVDWIKG